MDGSPQDPDGLDRDWGTRTNRRDRERFLLGPSGAMTKAEELRLRPAAVAAMNRDDDEPPVEREPDADQPAAVPTLNRAARRRAARYDAAIGALCADATPRPGASRGELASAVRRARRTVATANEALASPPPAAPPNLRASGPRRRGAGRPRAQATRSSAASGDSGKESDPPPERPPLARAPRALLGFGLTRCPSCGSVLLYSDGVLICANRTCPAWGTAA